MHTSNVILVAVGWAYCAVVTFKTGVTDLGICKARAVAFGLTAMAVYLELINPL